MEIILMAITPVIKDMDIHLQQLELISSKGLIKIMMELIMLLELA